MTLSRYLVLLSIYVSIRQFILPLKIRGSQIKIILASRVEIKELVRWQSACLAHPRLRVQPLAPKLITDGECCLLK